MILKTLNRKIQNSLYVLYTLIEYQNKFIPVNVEVNILVLCRAIVSLQNEQKWRNYLYFFLSGSIHYCFTFFVEFYTQLIFWEQLADEFNNIAKGAKYLLLPITWCNSENKHSINFLLLLICWFITFFYWWWLNLLMWKYQEGIIQNSNCISIFLPYNIHFAAYY